MRSHTPSTSSVPRGVLTLAALLALCAMLLPAAASALSPTGISGKVTDAETSNPISGAEACAYESAVETRVKCEKTNAGGEYTIEGLTTGSFYKVRFTADHYVTQWYQDETEWSSATPVEAKSGKRTTSVTVGTAHFSIAVGKSATIRVRLTAKGRSLLGKAGKRGLKVTFSGSGVKGRTLVLKATRAKHKKKK
jgi:hypothetical protein